MQVNQDDINQDKNTDNSNGEENANKTDGGTQATRPSWDLTQLPALVAVAGVVTTMIYASGVFVLWTPIALRYTQDVATSWHAVSLVPKTTVVGLGVFNFWVYSLFFIVYLLGWQAMVSSKVPLIKIIKRVIYASLTIIGLFGWYIIGRQVWGAIRGNRPKNLVPEWIPEWVPLVSNSNLPAKQLSLVETLVFTLGGVLVGALAFPLLLRFNGYLRSALEHSDKDNSERGSILDAIRDYRFPRIVSVPDFLKAISILVTIGFLQAVLLAILSSAPPVPRVELHSKEGANVRGDMLAHVEGFWYVLEPNGEVLAMPDDVIKKAHIHPRK